jgi:dihydrofolate reductase
MRTIRESAFVTLDGGTQDPRAWATPFFDEPTQDAAQAELEASDGLLMGRGTYEYFADTVPKQTGPYAETLNAIRKWVVSSTLERAEWNNSVILPGDAVPAVRELKAQGDGDLIMYGHGRLGRALLEAGLIDELRFAVHPILMHEAAGSLQLTSAAQLPTGVAVLAYRSAAAAT